MVYRVQGHISDRSHSESVSDRRDCRYSLFPKLSTALRDLVIVKGPP